MTRPEPTYKNIGNWGRLMALAAATWLVAGCLEGLLWVVIGRGDLDWRELFFGLSAFWGLAALLTPPLVWALRRIGFAPGRRLRALAWHLVVFAAVVVVHSILRQMWLDHVAEGIPFVPGKILPKLPVVLAKRAGGSMLVYMGVVGACLTWDYYQRFRERARAAAALELEQARLRASLSEARLEALQMQLQPHFLFNTLHAISTLILRGESRGANEMLSHLSRFLRMTLDSADSPTVPLAVELDSLDAYLRIQRERFRDRLHVALEIDEQGLSASVPNLVLQPLVENSIRHGIASDVGSGNIVVRAATTDGRLRLEVEDDGRGLPEGEPGNGGIGVRNIRERLEQLYPGDHEFTLRQRPEGGTLARIVIPLRHAERPVAPRTG